MNELFLLLQIWGDNKCRKEKEHIKLRIKNKILGTEIGKYLISKQV